MADAKKDKLQIRLRQGPRLCTTCQKQKQMFVVNPTDDSSGIVQKGGLKKAINHDDHGNIGQHPL